jgi:hypothetical protein
MNPYGDCLGKNLLKYQRRLRLYEALAEIEVMRSFAG